MRKVFFLLILFALLATATIFCGCNVAYAQETNTSNYEILTLDYLQLESPTLQIYDENNLYIFDTNRIIEIGNKTKFYDINFTPKSMAKVNEIIYFSTETNYKKLNLASGEASDVDLGINVGFTLFNLNKSLIAINDVSGDLVQFNNEMMSSSVTITELKGYSYTYQNSIYTSAAVWLGTELGLKYYIYKTQNNVSTKLFEIDFHGEIFVGNCIFIKNGSVLNAYDFSGSFLFSKDFETTNFACYQSENTLCVLNKDSLEVQFYSVTNNSLILFKTISKNHLSSPNDAYIDSNNTAICDNAKLYVNSTAYEIGAPKSLCKFDDEIITTNGNNIVKLKNEQLYSYTLPISDEILSLSADNNFVYILTQNSIYTYDGKFKKFADITGGKKIEVSRDGNLVYVLTSNGFNVFTKNANPSEFPFSDSTANIVDFTVDYVGNVAIATKDGKIAKYTRGVLSFTKSEEVPLNLTGFSLGDITSIDIVDDGTLIFTTSNNFLGKTSIFSFVTISSYTPSISPSIDETVSFATTVCTTLFYQDFNNYESVEQIEVKSKIVVLGTANGIFSYVLYGENLGYIKTSDLKIAEDTVTDKKVKVFLSPAYLYDYPLSTAPKTAVKLNTVLEIIGEGYTNNLQWHKVIYNEKKYYVPKVLTSVIKAEALTNQKSLFGRATSDKIGNKINLYQSADSSSKVVTTIVDGKELTIMSENINGFYKVKIGADIGYIKITQVKVGGITNAQIIGITCLCIAIAAGIIVLSVTTHLKKKKDAEKIID